MTARTTIASLHPHMSHADVRYDLAAETLDRLNGYDGENVWNDVILSLDGYDEAATDEVECGSGDAFVAAGVTYSHDHQRGEWIAEG